MTLLGSFDPWDNPLCTCPEKLSLNPYTGCAHGCLYCYASSYIRRFGECRPKPNLLSRLRREVRRIEPGTLVSMANSSDPYPPMEKELCLTRGCIGILKERGLKLQLVTKSNMVSRDLDLLEAMDCVVCITVTTLSEELAGRLEPGAPNPGKRLDAIMLLSKNGIPVSARLDPIIPGINESEIEDLISAVSQAGASHITASTYKARPDNWKRLKAAFPLESVALAVMLEKGDRLGGCKYLPREVRSILIQKMKDAAKRNGVTLSTCREDFSNGAGACCDGSHLIREIY
jgi:DNA repair photolyase